MVVTDDSNHVLQLSTATEGYGGSYKFQWVLAWGVALTVYSGTSGLDVWKAKSPKGLRVQLNLNMKTSFLPPIWFLG